MATKLTEKQAMFVKEYLVDLNATQAAIRAGYSEKTAEQQGYENLRKPEIVDAIKEAMAQRAERVELKADDVIRELVKIGFANMADFVTWGPDGIILKASDQLTTDKTAVVGEVCEKNLPKGGTEVSFKLHPKVKALELLGKHLGIFVDKVDLTANLTHSGVLRVPVMSPEQWAEMAKKQKEGGGDA